PALTVNEDRPVLRLIDDRHHTRHLGVGWPANSGHWYVEVADAGKGSFLFLSSGEILLATQVDYGFDSEFAELLDPTRAGLSAAKEVLIHLVEIRQLAVGQLRLPESYRT